MTKEELQNLPEYNPYETKILDNGDTAHILKPMKLSFQPLKADDVIMFFDGECSWMVEYGIEGGPYKRRFSI